MVLGGADSVVGAGGLVVVLRTADLVVGAGGIVVAFGAAVLAAPGRVPELTGTSATVLAGAANSPATSVDCVVVLVIPEVGLLDEDEIGGAWGTVLASLGLVACTLLAAVGLSVALFAASCGGPMIEPRMPRATIATNTPPVIFAHRCRYHGRCGLAVGSVDALVLPRIFN